MLFPGSRVKLQWLRREELTVTSDNGGNEKRSWQTSIAGRMRWRTRSAVRWVDGLMRLFFYERDREHLEMLLDIENHEVLVMESVS